MYIKSLKSLLKQFEMEMTKHAAAIDPRNEYDWYSLTLGWSLGKGLTPEEAANLTAHILYKTQLYERI